ncbi:SUKH-3 domain-containing protein [Streptomyces sp. SID3343]|uniref:SUKH-3 domain-containing protein n=1 Tax=Streptomyces sp. SID3343 TaxID=2690260 RepID=UPI00192517EC|nr:SUKH-3 domain-containing protein [Streptomyces sp. SID3343]
MSERFPAQVEEVLRGAGWFPGRDVSEDFEDWVAETNRQLAVMEGDRCVFPALHAALAEFGGITVRQDGPGVSLGRFDFSIGDVRAGAVPKALLEQEEMYRQFVLPFGWTADVHARLFMGIDGRVYLDHPIGGYFHLGANLDEALVVLVRGIKTEEVDFSHLEEDGLPPFEESSDAPADEREPFEGVPPEFLPATSGALTIATYVFTHTSLKGDGEPNLHPVLREFFDALPVRLRTTYIGRCAEAALVSDALWHMQEDWGDEPMDAEWACESFRVNTTAVTVTRIREWGDPTHGTFQPPCRSCAAMLEYFQIEVVPT